MLAPYFQKANHLLDEESIIYKKFIPPPTINTGECLRMIGDRYEVYNVNTGEVLRVGEFKEVPWHESGVIDP